MPTGVWLVTGALTFADHGGRRAGALGLVLLAGATVLLVPAAAGVASKPLASRWPA